MAFDFTDRDAQYDAEEATGSALLDGSGKGNDLLDSNAVPGGFAGIIGDARGLLRSGAGNPIFRKPFAADNVWDIRGLTSCTMTSWWFVNNLEQHHVFGIDDTLAMNAAGQALVMVARETNSGGAAGPWIFMGDGITRFVGASLKVKDTVTISTGVWQFFAGGYDAVRNKLFGFWGKAPGESFYKEVTGVVGGFGYVGTNTETLMGKFNGEAGQAQSYVDHCLWWNGRALTQSELASVWNNHQALPFDQLISSPPPGANPLAAGVHYYYR